MGKKLLLFFLKVERSNNGIVIAGLASEHPLTVNVLIDPTKIRTLKSGLLSYVFIILTKIKLENVNGIIIAGLVPEHPSAVNVLTDPTHIRTR